MKETRKQIAIIGTVGLPANYGGFETLTEHLVEDLSHQYEMTVYCSGKKYSKEKRKATYKGARLKYLPFNANGIQSIIYDTISILHALLFADVLLILGVAGAWTLPFVRLFTNKKIIISIDGIEWKRDKWSKLAKIFLWWSEGLAVKYSHFDISDNESIQDYTAQRYGSLSRVIEYGADHVIQVSATKSDLENYPFLKGKYAFKVCRIEPENNVEMILDTFSKQSRIPLVFVGNWKNSPFGIRLLQQYAANKNLFLLDPIYNQKDLDLLRSNAFIYVHGHSAGGTNPSLVEAMYLELPILCYKVAYNVTTTENQALYFKDSIELENLLQKSEFEFTKIGQIMGRIANRRYTWNRIAKGYSFLFKQVLNTPSKTSIKRNMPQWGKEKLLEKGLMHLNTQKPFYS